MGHFTAEAQQAIDKASQFADYSNSTELNLSHLLLAIASNKNSKLLEYLLSKHVYYYQLDNKVSKVNKKRYNCDEIRNNKDFIEVTTIDSYCYETVDLTTLTLSLLEKESKATFVFKIFNLDVSDCRKFLLASRTPEPVKLGGRQEVLRKAEEIINGERQAQYGTPEDSFKKIAQLWSVYTDIKVTSKDVAIMMALLKVARITTGVYKDDNWIDAIGYMACGAEIELNEPTHTIRDGYGEVVAIEGQRGVQ